MLKRIPLAALAMTVYYGPWVLFLGEDLFVKAALVIGYQCYLLGGIALVLYILMSERGRPMLDNALLAILSILMTASVADLGLRAYEAVTVERKFAHTGDPLLRTYKPNSSFQGKVCGDLSHRSPEGVCEEYDWTLQTDEHGFRNPAGTDLGPMDAIVLGDSIALGSKLRSGSTISRLLAERYGIRTYNLGVEAVNLWQEQAILESELSRFRLKPRAVLVWLIFTGNDLDDFHTTAHVSSETVVPVAETLAADIRSRSPLRKFIVAMGIKTGLIRQTFDVSDGEGGAGKSVLFYAPYVHAAMRGYEEVLAHPDYPVFKRSFDRIADIAGRAGLRVIAVAVPSKVETYPWLLGVELPSRRLSHAIGELALGRGMEFLDLQPEFHGEGRRMYYAGEGLLYWRDDTHLSEKGAAIAASMINSAIVRGLGDGGYAGLDDPAEMEME